MRVWASDRALGSRLSRGERCGSRLGPGARVAALAEGTMRAWALDPALGSQLSRGERCGSGLGPGAWGRSTRGGNDAGLGLGPGARVAALAEGTMRVWALDGTWVAALAEGMDSGRPRTRGSGRGLGGMIDAGLGLGPDAWVAALAERMDAGGGPRTRGSRRGLGGSRRPRPGGPGARAAGLREGDPRDTALDREGRMDAGSRAADVVGLASTREPSRALVRGPMLWPAPRAAVASPTFVRGSDAWPAGSRGVPAWAPRADRRPGPGPAESHRAGVAAVAAAIEAGCRAWTRAWVSGRLPA